MEEKKQDSHWDWKFLGRVLSRAFLLFIILNFVLTLLPQDVFGKVSLYNLVFPGRERFPFGEDPQNAYNLTLNSFDGMFASHLVSQAPAEDEFRLFVLGDSSVWGTLLRPYQTLAGQINAAGLTTCSGQTVKAYNLGYPTLSLFKDLMVLDQARQYQPDLIVWLVTLESFPQDFQLSSPIAANNAEKSSDLIQRYAIENLEGFVPDAPGFWEQTLFGRRRDLADLTRLQAYGAMWAATGIDQVYPADYTPALRDLEADETFHGWLPGVDLEDRLAFEILSAGEQAAGDVPVWFVNEPILISEGQNSDIRYNYYYPRWVFDSYRSLLADLMGEGNRVYLDLWDLVPEEEFTNSAIHLSPEGSQQLAKEMINQLKQNLCIQ